MGLGLLGSDTRCKDFFVVLKGRFLLEESLEEDINLLLSLAVNGITYSVVRRWERCEELLEHLRLIKRALHARVNSLDYSC